MRGIWRFLGILLALYSVPAFLFGSVLVLLVAALPPHEAAKLPEELAFLREGGPLTRVLGDFLMVLGAFALIEGRKSRILFLRPFRSVANRVVMDEFSARFGGRLSIVALDDGEISAPNSTWREKLVGGLVFVPVGIMLLLVAIASGVTMARELSGSFPSAVEIGEHFAELGITVFFGITAAVSVRKGFVFLFPLSNRMHVSSRGDLLRAVIKIKQLARYRPRFYSTRSLVFSSSDAWWRTCVEKFAAKCDYVLIDLSQMTDNIAWELANLKSRMPDRFIVLLDEGAELPDGIRTEPVIRYRDTAGGGKDALASIFKLIREAGTRGSRLQRRFR